MKKALIVMDSMICGGIERSAISMLQLLSPSDYQITLLLFKKEGDFLQDVPSWVEVCEVPWTKRAREWWFLGRKKALLRYFLTIRWVTLIHFFLEDLLRRQTENSARRKISNLDMITQGMKWRTISYDCAMAYSNETQAFFINKFVQAKKKVAWFHGEFVGAHAKPDEVGDLYDTFHFLVVASLAMKKSVSHYLPLLSSKVVCCPLCINGKMIYDLSYEYEGFNDLFQGLKLLSVGRATDQKGFDIALDVLRKLKDDDLKVKWYFIGEGSELDLLREKARNLDLTEDAVFLGLIKNPYPYFRTTDLYVQPSRYEGFCLTVAEARVFNKPIVCTDFAGAREQIIPGESGTIVSCNIEEIYHAVKELILSSDKRIKYTECLSQQDPSMMSLSYVKMLID